MILPELNSINFSINQVRILKGFSVVFYLKKEGKIKFSERESFSKIDGFQFQLLYKTLSVTNN
ncbi:MAG TPA: hypothetical protein VNZ49_15125 [Bacteroidia bacterium]|nr:hypothetical protein [Bacteroidia bacterium]